MNRKQLTAGVMLILVLTLLAASACGTKAAANSASTITAKQTSTQAQVNGDLVSIPLSEVDKYTNTRFTVKTATNNMSFMAYKYDNQLQIRADICPPCGSQSFTLKNGTLVCDTCGTVFDAKTGAGIQGACVKYAKQAVSFENKDGNLVMKSTDLVTAFKNTISPKK